MEFQPDSHPGDLTPLDVMLAEIAVRIQLSPTDYNKAASRHEAISKWIDRSDSPLAGRVELIYPQGSMAIGATIARCSGQDEYDIDVMAQLDLPLDRDPEVVLSLLAESIRGKPGSLYHHMAKRRTRCVTVKYADGMHLDVTPAIRLPERPERTSFIFHSKPEDPDEPKKRLYANPYGFSQVFIAKTSANEGEFFPEYFEQRSLEVARLHHDLTKGETEPVPDQMPVYRKSRALIVLQLLKQFRNLRYEQRPNLRRPPSVLLSKYVADHAHQTATLAEELIHQASAMLNIFKTAHQAGKFVYETNPACDDDVLTDRWPASLEDQERFIADLQELIRALERLLEGKSLNEMRQILEHLFGKRPVGDVVEDYIKRYGKQIKQGGGTHLPGTAQIPAAGVMLGAAPAVARETRAPRFYGDKPK